MALLLFSAFVNSRVLVLLHLCKINNTVDREIFTVKKEPVVEVDEAQKFTQLALRLWSREVSDSLYLIVQWSNALAADMVSEER